MGEYVIPVQLVLTQKLLIALLILLAALNIYIWFLKPRKKRARRKLIKWRTGLFILLAANVLVLTLYSPPGSLVKTSTAEDGIDQPAENQPSDNTMAGKLDSIRKALRKGELSRSEGETGVQSAGKSNDWRMSDEIAKERIIENYGPAGQLFLDGIQLRQRQQHARALTAFTDAVSLRSDFSEAWVERGKVLERLGRHDESVASHDSALALNPELHEAWCYRGMSLTSLEKYDEALETYENAIRTDPDCALGWTNRGFLLKRLKRIDEAIASYDSALAHNPRFSDAWCFKGIALHDLKRYEEAVECYDSAIKYDHDYVEAWTRRGLALHPLGKFEEAVASYDSALSYMHDYAWAWHNRGISIDTLGFHEEALRNWDSAKKYRNY